MWNPFNKPKTETSYPAIVEEIHNEFYTAGETILQEATCLLKELEQKDLAKGKRLAALGFGKTREAVAAIETENKLATTKEIAELVVYYQANYPNNKFITEAQVKQICEKYGLILGDTSMYKGFVPENKLSLIEGFKVKDKDRELLFDFGGTYYTLQELKETSVFGVSKYISNQRDYDYLISVGKPAKSIYGYPRSKYDDDKLKICAPLKDMEIPQGKEVKGYKIQDIPDPVVLQPVKGGCLIVCAWGDEASDEIVVNQKMN